MKKVIEQKFPFFLPWVNFYIKNRDLILLGIVTIIFVISYFESFRWPFPGVKATHGIAKAFSLLLITTFAFFSDKDKKKLKTVSNLLMVLFFTSYLVSSVFSLDLGSSLLHLWYPFMALVIFLTLSFIKIPKTYYYLVILISTLLVFLTFSFSFFSIIFRYSVDNIYYFLFLDHRANHLLSEIRQFGKYASLGPYVLLAPLPMVFLIQKSASFLRKNLALLVYLLTLLTVVISNNRIDVVVMVVHFFFYSFLFTKKQLLSLLIPSLIVIWFGLLTTQAYFGFNLEERILRPSDERDKQTIEMRFTYWQTALNNFKNFPIFGTGPNTYNVVSDFPLRKYFSDGVLEYSLEQDEGIGVHNVFIERLADTGLFGFFTFVFILLFFFKEDYKSLVVFQQRKNKEEFKQYMMFSLASWTWVLYGITDNGYGAQGFVSFFFLRGILTQMGANEKA